MLLLAFNLLGKHRVDCARTLFDIGCHLSARGTAMKQAFVILVALALAALLAAPALAREIRGTVVTMDKFRLVIEVAEGGGKSTFLVTSDTKLFGKKGPLPVHRVARNTRVRVVDKFGVAQYIFVEGVPK
jgi:hypothetical protein